MDSRFSLHFWLLPLLKLGTKYFSFSQRCRPGAGVLPSRPSHPNLTDCTGTMQTNLSRDRSSSPIHPSDLRFSLLMHNRNPSKVPPFQSSLASWIKCLWPWTPPKASKTSNSAQTHWFHDAQVLELVQFWNSFKPLQFTIPKKMIPRSWFRCQVSHKAQQSLQVEGNSSDDLNTSFIVRTLLFLAVFSLQPCTYAFALLSCRQNG